VPPAITPEPPQTAPRAATIRYPGRTLPVLSINYKAPAWSATDTLGVALTLLGDVAFGSNSEIYRKLVLQEGRVQSLGARFGLSRDPALVGIQATVARPDDVAAVEQELYAAARRFQETLVDPALLARTRSALKYGFLMRLETAQDVAFSAAQAIVSTGRLEALEDYYRTLEAITPEQVREAARKYLGESGRNTITMVQEN
jgi:zinc protease